jgi:hypothetical protein
MKISVIYDEKGRITAAQEIKSGGSDKATIRLVAGPGQHHAELDAPSHHKGKAFSEVAHQLKVAHASGSPALVDA